MRGEGAYRRILMALALAVGIAGVRSASAEGEAPGLEAYLWSELGATPVRVRPGHDFALELAPGAPGAEALKKLAEVRLALGQRKAGGGRAAPSCASGGILLSAYRRESQGSAAVVVRIPAFDELKRSLKPSTTEGAFNAFDGVLCFCDASAAEACGEALPPVDVEIAEPFWAMVWASGAALACWVGLGVLFRKRDARGLRRYFDPLAFALDRTNHYNPAQLQFLVWTLVTIFGLVFVWKVAERFLDISTQVLMLLGIGGVSAVVTTSMRNARWREIPARFRQKLEELESPRPSDLLTEDGQPSVVRLQMLGFTLLIAGTVIKEIYEKYAFPSLSDGLVALMGVSSALYVGSGTQPAEPIDKLTKLAQELDAPTTPPAASAAPEPASPPAPREKEEQEKRLLKSLRGYFS